jgi:hypothetical protein
LLNCFHVDAVPLLMLMDFMGWGALNKCLHLCKPAAGQIGKAASSLASRNP